MRLSAGCTRFTHCCAVLMAFYSRPETASGVISGTFVWPIIPDTHEKSRDLRLYRSREIPPEAVGGVIFGRFFERRTK